MEELELCPINTLYLLLHIKIIRVVKKVNISRLLSV